MTPEILTALTTAKGTPLDGSKGATPLERAEMAAWLRPGRGGRDGSVRWSSNKGTRSSKRAQWSLAEAALACGGMTDRHYWALRYSFAQDDSVTGDGMRPYLPSLATMVLLEERAPSRFLKPSKAAIGRPRCMHATILNIATNLWRRSVEPKYELLVNEYRIWLGAGVSHMRKALRDDGLE
jgi:hypothetical protein